MNAKVSAKNWIGMALLVALVGLLATANVNAMDATAVYSIAPLAIECDVLLTEDVDPLMAVAEADVPCDNLIAPKMSSVEFTGNVAWATVIVGDETELHVFMKRDGGEWERIPYSSAPDQAYLDLLERENAFFEEEGSAASARVLNGPRASTADALHEFLSAAENARAEQLFSESTATAAQLSEVGDGSAAAPDASYLYAQQQERAAQEQANPAPSFTVGSPAPDASYLYAQQQERAAQERGNPAPAAPDVSIDPRGESYWNEILTEQEGTLVVTPSRAGASSDDTVDPVALAEREIGYDAGSDLNTLAELDVALFDERWAENAAGEDLSREDVVADIVVGSATDWAMASDPLAESYGFIWTGSPTAR